MLPALVLPFVVLPDLVLPFVVLLGLVLFVVLPVLVQLSDSGLPDQLPACALHLPVVLLSTAVLSQLMLSLPAPQCASSGFPRSS